VNTEKDRNIIIGLAAFACAILFLIFAAAPIQQRLGLLGMGITEIGLLIIAIGGSLLLKGGWRDVFPFKKPRFDEIRGSIYIYIGVYCLTIGLSYALMYFFPRMIEVNNAVTEFFSEGGIMLFVTVSVLPGICEEMLFRGTIQSSFRRVKSTVATVLIVGALFGLFHLSVYRFVPTMILGAGLTYVMVQTGNLLYTMVLHAIHNLIGILPILLGRSPGGASALSTDPVVLVGWVLVFCSLAVLFLRPGVRRLNGIDSGGAGKVKRALFIVLCVVLILGGLVLAFIGGEQPILDRHLSVTVEEEYDDILHFEIAAAGVYQIEIVIESESVISSVLIISDQDVEVFNPGSGMSFSASAPINLDIGYYTCIITLTPPDTGEAGQADIHVSVKR